MFKYYVKLDEQGYPVADGQPAITAVEGMAEFVAYTTTDKEYFLRYYSHYRQDGNGNWVAPDNLPSLQVSSLLRSIQDQGQMIADRDETIEGLKNDLTTAKSSAESAKSAAVQATEENATLKANDSLHDSAIVELSDLLFSQLAPSEPSASETTNTVADGSTSAVTSVQS